MKKEEQLELVEFILPEGDNLRAVSIVSDPAIEKSFKLFKKMDISTFKTVSDEKMEIVGIAMTPNKPILRINEDTGEYYNCWFSEETIKSCMHTFLKYCNHTTANFEHGDIFTSKVSVMESWIVEDPNNDKLNALGFTDITKGDWALTYKVEDAELWASIKESGFTGFSIEGFFNYFEAIKNDEHKTKLIYSIINSGLSDSDKEALIKKIIK